MGGGIFVSYRRDDGRHAAGRLLDRLRQTYEPHQLFMDVDNVAPGIDFVKVLSEQVAACEVMLVVIGPNWLDARDVQGVRRLDNSGDFVRVEVEAALKRDVRVIPILVDGASIPHEDTLPEPLRPLARRQSVRLTHERFGSEADDIVRSLHDVVQPAGKKPVGSGSSLATKAALRGIAVGSVGLVAGLVLSAGSVIPAEAILGRLEWFSWPGTACLMLLAITWFLLAAGFARGAAASTLYEVACAASSAAAWFLTFELVRHHYLSGTGLTLALVVAMGVALSAYALSIRLYLWKVWKVIVGGNAIVTLRRDAVRPVPWARIAAVGVAATLLLGTPPAYRLGLWWLEEARWSSIEPADATVRADDIFRDCLECPEMVVVPAGNFTMGSPDTEEGRAASEGPQRRVTIARVFAVGRFAVTFQEWDACLAASGCKGYRPTDWGFGRSRQPVIDVSWKDAKAYVAWLSSTTGKAYRLLSEAEREYVTRAGTATPFWWGTSISTSQANYKSSYWQKPVPVYFFGTNPWGLYQVHGNVWEWVEDCWSNSYQGAPADGSARTFDDCTYRVLRGGSFYEDALVLRSASRTWGMSQAFVPRSTIGFRVARTLD